MTIALPPRFVRHKPQNVPTYIEPASFIWHPDQWVYFDPVVNSFCCFRKVFALDQQPGSAELCIFADSRYQLFINGRYIARGPCRSDPTWQYVDHLDIAEHLWPGKNVIAVLALFFGYGTGQSTSLTHGLFAEATICDPAGHITTLTTDDTWRCHLADWYDSAAPRINGRQGPIEIYDARRAIDWTAVDFDDADWPTARGAIFVPLWNFAPRDIPMLEETMFETGQVSHAGMVNKSDAPGDLRNRTVQQCAQAHLQPLASPADCAGYTVEPTDPASMRVVMVDLGCIESGYLMLEVEGPAGAIIDAVYSEEHLNGQIFPDKANCSMDRFILAGGRNRLEVAFGWKAFRYVQLFVSDHDEPVVIRRFGLRRRRYPIEQVGRFDGGDPLLTKVYDLSLHTLRLCMQDGYLDSSSREQQQWMGDGRWQAVINYYVSGDARLHRKLLHQIGQSQNWLGLTRARYPDNHFNFTTIPPFGLAWVCSFWDYYLFTGDNELFADWWPHIVHLLRWFTAYEQDDGLLHRVPYWVFIEWGGLSYHPGEHHDVITPLNLMYLEALNTARRIAQYVGDQQAAQVYADKAVRLRSAVIDKLWDSDRKVYADTFNNGAPDPAISEATHALALLHLHDASDPRADDIFGSIWGAQRHDDISPGSPYLFVLVCRALAKIGRTQTAMDLLRQRFGKMLDAGATATWEQWELYHRDAAGNVNGVHSASHAWGANPIIFFTEAVAGIVPLAPGFAMFSVCPALCELDHIDVAVPTPHGVITLHAEARDDAVDAQLIVPTGTQAQLPDGRTLAAGTHCLTLAGDIARTTRTQRP